MEFVIREGVETVVSGPRQLGHGIFEQCDSTLCSFNVATVQETPRLW